MLKLLSAVIARLDERQRRDMRRPRHVAHDERERGAVVAMRRIDIAHRDRRADRRAEAAAGYRADAIAGGIGDDRALACWRAPVGPDADALARDAFGEL